MGRPSRGATAELLRHRPFRNQFVANALSMVGSALTPVALAFGVLHLTGSAGQLGLVLAAYSVPQVVLMIVGGVWADRLPRQHVMITADAVRLFTQAGFGVLLVTGWSPLWAMMALQALCGSATAFFLPASVGLVADTAPSDRVQEANALLSLTRNLTGTVGPIVAGGLVAVTGAGWALIIDGITFGGSLIFLAKLRLPARETTPHSSDFRADFVSGWREVSRRSWVWSTILYCMVFNLAFSSYQVLGPAKFAGESGGAMAWGVMVAGLGIGQLAGNSMALMWKPDKPLLAGRLIMLGGAPVFFLMGSGAPFWLTLAASIICGTSISFPDTLWDAALQRHIDGAALSRVSSFDFLGSFLLRPVGFGLSAAAASWFGADSTLIVSAAVVVVATLVSLTDSSVRRLGREPVEDSAGVLVQKQ
ncbi:MFS transporter [Streptomyces goshikiensis]|uniref:MFS transporter n=1 Tax=Streptomyces goshikiensis TaxID=1942 RepID=UPI0036FF1C6A